MRAIFQQTRIVKKPTYGIVSGYHELPYVCLGESFDPDRATTAVRGKIQVSPRFIVRPEHLEPSYREIFGEDFLDAELAGRMFGFLGFKRRPVECTSEHLEVAHTDAPLQTAVDEELDGMARREDITTGLIVTPNSRYFQVSVERFITTILEDEFSTG
jgi:hypothetical protein